MVRPFFSLLSFLRFWALVRHVYARSSACAGRSGCFSFSTRRAFLLKGAVFFARPQSRAPALPEQIFADIYFGVLGVRTKQNPADAPSPQRATPRFAVQDPADWAVRFVQCDVFALDTVLPRDTRFEWLPAYAAAGMSFEGANHSDTKEFNSTKVAGFRA